ncbi:MAG: fluoride efflux transporter CrcB [Peptostreptococcaceae bacterium]|nr:fluoride efflux transporter CrcB [Peptostreptococcaceae bacterium]
MINCLIVGLGGFTGAVMRYLMTGIPIVRMDFPYITLLINILGSLLIGIVVAISAKSCIMNDNAMLFLKVGLCGGFTTFSSFALETQELMADGNVIASAAYVILSVSFCVFAVYIGQALVDGVSVMIAIED